MSWMPQARGVLDVYRNDLRNYSNSVTAIEKAKAQGKADPNAQASIDRLTMQALRGSVSAARNLFVAAGHRVPIGPGGRYTVVLGPANGPAGAGSAGIWIEPSTSSPAVSQLVKSYAPNGRPSAPVTGPTVCLRVVPEPRIEWVRTTGIRVDHAVDDMGRAVQANLSAVLPNLANHSDEIILLGGGRRAYVTGMEAVVHPYYASIILKSELPVPAILREFRGSVTGVVKTTPQRVITRTC